MGGLQRLTARACQTMVEAGGWSGPEDRQTLRAPNS